MARVDIRVYDEMAKGLTNQKVEKTSMAYDRAYGFISMLLIGRSKKEMINGIVITAISTGDVVVLTAPNGEQTHINIDWSDYGGRGAAEKMAEIILPR